MSAAIGLEPMVRGFRGYSGEAWLVARIEFPLVTEAQRNVIVQSVKR